MPRRGRPSNSGNSGDEFGAGRDDSEDELDSLMGMPGDTLLFGELGLSDEALQPDFFGALPWSGGAQRLGCGAKDVLATLEERTHTCSGERADGACAVCLECFDMQDELRALPCGHQFHCSCVDPWLLGGGACPLCRRGL